MAKLYVFGCSYSALYGVKQLNNPTINAYYKFRGDSFPQTWSEILSKDLNLELVNLADWGSDNYSIFENFCKVVDDIKEDDIVIIGWTEVTRFRLFSEKSNSFKYINVWDIKKNLDLINVSEEVIKEIIVNRDNQRWSKEVYNWMGVINRLSKSIGFKMHHWSFFIDFPDLYIINDILQLGAKTIGHETNDEIPDWHFGEKGHEVQAEYFKNLLLNKKIPKLI
jgi:hypothetical protein